MGVGKRLNPELPILTDRISQHVGGFENRPAHSATDSTFAQIYVESRAKFLELPTSKRYYEVKFFLSKEPHAALRDCKIIVDGDNMNPLVSNVKIGDVPAGEPSRVVNFQLRSRDDDPQSRELYVECENTYSPTVKLSLRRE
jgi:hypothetical protein